MRLFVAVGFFFVGTFGDGILTGTTSDAEAKVVGNRWPDQKTVICPYSRIEYAPVFDRSETLFHKKTQVTFENEGVFKL